jgi:excisionase family DNA binding protein
MNKTIPYLKIGNRVRFRESDIEKWLSKKKK